MVRIREVMPVFQVKNVQASVDFYRDKLGFRPRYQNGDAMAIVERDGTDIILTRADDESWRTRANFLQRPVASGAESFLPGTGSCRIRVEGVDELYAAYKAQGLIHSNGTLRDQPWGVRDFGIGDLDGNALAFFEPLASSRD